MKSQYLVAANWKMNFTPREAAAYAHKLAAEFGSEKEVEIVVAPNFVALPFVAEALKNSGLEIAAQNVNEHDEGAFTGEVSVPMLKNLADYVIIGHSERRHLFRETDQEIRSKVQAVLRGGLKVILCIGDTAAEHVNHETMHVIRDQLNSGLRNVSSTELKDVVIAYEPVWALSNGRDFERHSTPSTEELSKVLTEIRRQIKALFGETAMKSVRLLYGGSTNSDNSSAYIELDDLNGFLVGGASLNLQTFKSIIKNIGTKLPKSPPKTKKTGKNSKRTK